MVLIPHFRLRGRRMTQQDYVELLQALRVKHMDEAWEDQLDAWKLTAKSLSNARYYQNHPEQREAARLRAQRNRDKARREA